LGAERSILITTPDTEGKRYAKEIVENSKRRESGWKENKYRI